MRESKIVGIEAQKRLLEKTDTVRSVGNFLKSDFRYFTNDKYPSLFRESLPEHPHRINPDYLRLVAVMALEVARFGYTEPAGHLRRIDTLRVRDGRTLDYFHPIYIASNIARLAELNKKTYETRRSAVEYHNRVDGPDKNRDAKIWAIFRGPEGFAKLPHPTDIVSFYDSHPIDSTNRTYEALPIYIPDPEFFNAIVDTQVSREMIEQMTGQQHIDELAEAFSAPLSSVGVNIRSILQNPNETWLK